MLALAQIARKLKKTQLNFKRLAASCRPYVDLTATGNNST